MNARHHARSGSFGAIAGALSGASIFGLLAAASEAHSATSASGESFGAAFAVIAGVLTPLALGVAIGVGLARLIFVPRNFGAAVWSYLAPGPARAERSLGLLLAPFAFVVFTLVTARWALFVLSSESPDLPAGAALSVGVVVLGATLALAVTLGVRAAGPARSLPSPRTSLALSLAVSGLFIAALVAFGEPSGGGSVWTEFGVLRRDELDLMPVGLLSAIVLGAALAPRLRSALAAIVASALALAPLGFTAFAAEQGLEAPSLALAIERAAPLSARVLAPLRRLSDGDHDGFSTRFGGGDCDDSNAARNPDEPDVPGNGIDEDCSGADARVYKPRGEATKGADAGAQDARKGVPSDLNVLLVTIDTLRADLGYAGGARPISPRIDELAKESVVFERAYALASYTAKSMPPMLIGKYSGETQRGYSHFNRFDESETFVAERLQRAGIRTISVQGHWYFFQQFGMERGFDVINSTAAPRSPQLEGDKGFTSEALSNAVLRELEAPGLGTPRFFMWVHYTDPHADYVEHEGFDFGRGSRARYDSEVAFVDHHLGRVLDALRKSPLWEKTAVILTSDHGEAFGEHGMIRHGFELWEELVRVPLLVRIPGVSPRRVTERRSLIDLVPTLLDLYGLPPPSGQGSDFLSGQSLLGELRGASAAPPRAVFVDMSEGPHNKERRAFIEGDLKLVTSNGLPLSLYDLASDPGETKELSSDRERVAAALERYKAFQATLREVKVRRPRSE